MAAHGTCTFTVTYTPSTDMGRAANVSVALGDGSLIATGKVIGTPVPATKPDSSAPG